MPKHHGSKQQPKTAQSLDELAALMKAADEAAQEIGDQTETTARVEQTYVPAQTHTKVSLNGEMLYTSTRLNYDGSEQTDQEIESRSVQAKSLGEKFFDKNNPFDSFIKAVPKLELPDGEEPAPLAALQQMRDCGKELTFARLSTPWGATSLVDRAMVESLKPGEVVWSYLKDGISVIYVLKDKATDSKDYAVVLKVYKTNSMQYDTWVFGDLRHITAMKNDHLRYYESLPELDPSLWQKLKNLF